MLYKHIARGSNTEQSEAQGEVRSRTEQEGIMVP
jgi:hypothetical protein